MKLQNENLKIKNIRICLRSEVFKSTCPHLNQQNKFVPFNEKERRKTIGTLAVHQCGCGTRSCS